jgi:hypothetical protein
VLTNAQAFDDEIAAPCNGDEGVLAQIVDLHTPAVLRVARGVGSRC